MRLSQGGNNRTRTCDPLFVRHRQRIRCVRAGPIFPSKQGIWTTADNYGRSQMVCEKVCKPVHADDSTTVVIGGDTKIN